MFVHTFFCTTSVNIQNLLEPTCTVSSSKRVLLHFTNSRYSYVFNANPHDVVEKLDRACKTWSIAVATESKMTWARFDPARVHPGRYLVTRHSAYFPAFRVPVGSSIHNCGGAPPGRPRRATKFKCPVFTQRKGRNGGLRAAAAHCLPRSTRWCWRCCWWLLTFAAKRPARRCKYRRGGWFLKWCCWSRWWKATLDLLGRIGAGGCCSGAIRTEFKKTAPRAKSSIKKLLKENPVVQQAPLETEKISTQNQKCKIFFQKSLILRELVRIFLSLWIFFLQ